MLHVPPCPSRNSGDEELPGEAPIIAEPAGRVGPPLEYARLSLFGMGRLMRPKQWVKNVFVLAPLVFSGLSGNVEVIAAALWAMVCFCLWSSAVYCLNDILDAGADRRHPRKKNRPIPSGQVSLATAMLLAAALISGGFVLAWAFLPARFLWGGALYLANSVCYCLLLKQRVIVDVLSIAIGFVLRLLAGCWAIQVEPSSWILVCGFALALLLGFGKRRLEISISDQIVAYRPSLQCYSVEKLNLLLGVTSAICLLSYMLYTTSPETERVHNTNALVYTVPFVAYGVFRYLFKVQEGKNQDGPVEVLLGDPIFALNGLLWMASVVAVLYLRPLL